MTVPLSGGMFTLGSASQKVCGDRRRPLASPRALGASQRKSVECATILGGCLPLGASLERVAVLRPDLGTPRELRRLLLRRKGGRVSARSADQGTRWGSPYICDGDGGWVSEWYFSRCRLTPFMRHGPLPGQAGRHCVALFRSPCRSSANARVSRKPNHSLRPAIIYTRRCRAS